MTPLEHDTWKKLFASQEPLRSQQIVPFFEEGLKSLGIGGERIPALEEVNTKLKRKTGWEGIFVDGFKPPEIFFEMLSKKQFPVGNFIRSASDLTYTPEPDIFHDLYGHIPFYANEAYAEFNRDFGTRALKYKNDPEKLVAFQRLFWFTLEFGLLRTEKGLRVFGAGITSSFQECAYALSGQPQVFEFDLKRIKNQDFRIDLLQDKLFVLNSPQELYECLDAFEREVAE